MNSEMRYITVTKYGEKIRFQLDSDLIEDTKIMNFGIHCHKVCGGFIDKKQVSPSHWILKCRSCGLRVIIPNEIDTYKKLRKYSKILRREKENAKT